MNYLNKALDLFNTAVVRRWAQRGLAWAGLGAGREVAGRAVSARSEPRCCPHPACAHPQPQVTPIYYVMFTSATCAASMVMMREQQTAAQVLTEASGFVTIVCGVFLLTTTKAGW